MAENVCIKCGCINSEDSKQCSECGQKLKTSSFKKYTKGGKPEKKQNDNSFPDKSEIEINHVSPTQNFKKIEIPSEDGVHDELNSVDKGSMGISPYHEEDIDSVIPEDKSSFKGDLKSPKDIDNNKGDIKVNEKHQVHNKQHSSTTSVTKSEDVIEENNEEKETDAEYFESEIDTYNETKKEEKSLLELTVAYIKKIFESPVADKKENVQIKTDFNSDGFYDDVESDEPPKSDKIPLSIIMKYIGWGALIIGFFIFMILYV